MWISTKPVQDKPALLFSLENAADALTLSLSSMLALWKTPVQGDKALQRLPVTCLLSISFLEQRLPSKVLQIQQPLAPTHSFSFLPTPDAKSGKDTGTYFQLWVTAPLWPSRALAGGKQWRRRLVFPGPNSSVLETVGLAVPPETGHKKHPHLWALESEWIARFFSTTLWLKSAPKQSLWWQNDRSFITTDIPRFSKVPVIPFTLQKTYISTCFK